MVADELGRKHGFQVSTCNAWQLWTVMQQRIIDDRGRNVCLLLL